MNENILRKLFNYTEANCTQLLHNAILKESEIGDEIEVLSKKEKTPDIKQRIDALNNDNKNLLGIVKPEIMRFLDLAAKLKSKTKEISKILKEEQ